MYATYHVRDPQTFYSGDRAWALPGALAITPPSNNGTLTTTNEPFRPYYVVSKIEGSSAEHFVLFEPFTPPSRANIATRYGALTGLIRGWRKARKIPPARRCASPKAGLHGPGPASDSPRIGRQALRILALDPYGF